MTHSLFRNEVLAAQNQRLVGEIDLSQPLYLRFWVLSFALLLAIAFGFVVRVDVHAKETVRGVLTPTMGVIHINAPLTGAVQKIHVSQGDLVNAGEPIFTIGQKHVSLFRGSVEENLTKSIEAQSRLNEDAISMSHRALAETLKQVDETAEDLDQQLRGYLQQRKLLKQRLAIHTHRYELLLDLGPKGEVSSQELAEAKDATLQISQLVLETEQQILATRRSIANNQSEQKQLPFRHKDRMRQMLAEQAKLEMQLERLHSSFNTVVEASVSARVTALQATPNQQVNAGDELATLIPEDSSLEVELHLPSRSIGLVSVGDETLIRFDAFPHQKYGHVTATIVEIDQSAESFVNQHRFRVRAELHKQQMAFEGDSYPFKAGMLVEADVLLEKRKVWDWIAAPLSGSRKSST